MNHIEKIKQLLYQYEYAGLIEGNVEKVLSFIADNIIGIGMGEQGFITSKKMIYDLLTTTMRKDPSAVYELDIQNIIVQLTTEVTADVCASVSIKRYCNGQTTMSNFMQSLSLILQDDHWRICMLHASPMILTEESIESYPFAFADNTLAQLKSELRDEAFELINNNLSGGVFGTYNAPDHKHPLYFVNESMIKTLGYSREEFLFKFKTDTTSLIYPEDYNYVMENIYNMLSKENEFEIQYRLVKKDGDIIWVIERGKTFTTKDGKDVVLAAFTEITELVSMQLALQKKTHLLEEQSEELALQNEELLCQRKELEKQTKELAASEERFRLALQKTTNIIFDYDIKTQRFLCSRMPKEVVDYTIPPCIIGKKLIENAVLSPDSLKNFNETFELIRNGTSHKDCIVSAKHSSGKNKWYKISMTNVLGLENTPQRIIGLIEDITRQKEAEIAYKREEQYHNAILSDTMGVFIINFSRGIFESCQIFDNRCSDVSDGEPYDTFMRWISSVRMTPSDQKAFMEKFSRANVLEAFNDNQTELKLEYHVINADGTGMWMQTILRLVIDVNTNERKGFLYVIDINERKEKELALTYKSEHDVMTGLYNKAASEKYIQQRLQTAEGIMSGVFLMLDIDYFKEINDTFGHPVGDQVLKEVAEILSSCFRDTDVIGRIGGDEFCIFLSGLSVEKRVAEAAGMICGKIARIKIHGYRNWHNISCSIGISMCNGHPKTFKELYQEADSALYSVKQRGRNGYAFYQSPNQSA